MCSAISVVPGVPRHRPIQLFRPRLPLQRQLRYLFTAPVLRADGGLDASAHAVPNAIEIRPYQKDSLNACLDALGRGVSRIGVSLPTGSGKTTVFVNLIHAIPAKTNGTRSNFRAMVIVNSLELAHQAINQLANLFPQTTVALEQGAQRASEHAEIVVATYQSLNSKQRYQRFDPADFKCIIVDEAHHALSASYLQILSHFNHGVSRGTQATDHNVSTDWRVPIIGFSATFSRHDRLALSAVFEEIVYHYELKDMIQAGWLAPARFTSVEVNMDLSGVSLTGGKEPDYVPSGLAEVVDTDAINDVLVSIYLDRASQRKSTLIFTVNIQHMYRVANKFRDAGIDARVIYSGTPAAERKTLLGEFRSLKFPVLVNCAVLTEGADVPNVDCVILARPTRSRTLLTQMIGRGLRKSVGTGKTDCLVIDIFPSVLRGVLIRPSLEGLDYEQLFALAVDEPEEAQALETDKVTNAEVAEPQPSQVSVNSLTYTDYESPFQDEAEYRGVGDLYRLTRYGWVACGDGIFVLELLGYGHIRIQPEREAQATGYIVQFVRRWKQEGHPGKRRAGTGNPGFIKARVVGRAESVAEAIKTSDAFIDQAGSRTLGMSIGLIRNLERNAQWRRLPATAQQKKVIEDRLGGGKNGRVVDTENLNKGQAANLLTRLKHGYKSRLEKRIREINRTERTAVKISQRDELSKVKVGKLG